MLWWCLTCDCLVKMAFALLILAMVSSFECRAVCSCRVFKAIADWNAHPSPSSFAFPVLKFSASFWAIFESDSICNVALALSNVRVPKVRLLWASFRTSNPKHFRGGILFHAITKTMQPGSCVHEFAICATCMDVEYGDSNYSPLLDFNPVQETLSIHTVGNCLDTRPTNYIVTLHRFTTWRFVNLGRQLCKRCFCVFE